MRISILGLVGGLIAGVVVAQSVSDPLPRRGYFGVALEQSLSGVRVTGVAPGSTAAEAGISAGDVIVAIDGLDTPTSDAVVSSIARHRGGDSVSIRIQQAGDSRTMTVTLKAYPSEQIQNATVSYGSVESQLGVRLRTITSVPITLSLARYPAVLLVQGGGCGSIDTPIGPAVGPTGLIHTIGSHGFITMRVEKSGVGDSQGEPCASIGFKEEFAGYQAALKALLSHPAVDRGRIYLVGISLGGVFSPLLAAETHVAGISVYGTPAGPPPVYPGRSERFFQEFAKVDVAAAWAKVNTRVQVLHGEYDADPVVNRAVHESIAAMINKAHPGSATFREFAGLDHCWTRHASLEASKDKCGQGEETRLVQDEILNFLSSRI
jgi:dienelactone hydrolase